MLAYMKSRSVLKLYHQTLCFVFSFLITLNESQYFSFRHFMHLYTEVDKYKETQSSNILINHTAHCKCEIFLVLSHTDNSPAV